MPEAAALALVASRILGDTHGFVYVLENDDGTPVVTRVDEAVVLMRGMLYGTADEMCAQMEYTIECLRGRSVCAIIDASHPSFRFPDAAVRVLFGRMRALRIDIRRIIFAGMSLVVRVGFRTFALPLLDNELREKISVVSSLATAAEHLGIAWPSAARDPSAWVRHRALIEDVDITHVALRSFDSRYIDAANSALADAAKKPVDALSNAVYDSECQKRGSGGVFGTVRWRRKHIWVCIESGEAILVYRDEARGEYSQPIRPLRCVVDDLKCVVHTNERAYTFHFASDRACRHFEEAVTTAQR